MLLASVIASAAVFAADPTPDPSIKVQVLIGGGPAVGSVELVGKIGYPGVLSDGQKLLLGKAFHAAVIPIRRGQSIPFSVRITLPGGASHDVTDDERLYVDSTLTALKFERTGHLVAVPAPGMPDIKVGIIYTVHIYYFPDEQDRSKFGYEEIYFKPIE
jgi:hypothetical protein